MEEKGVCVMRNEEKERRKEREEERRSRRATKRTGVGYAHEGRLKGEKEEDGIKRGKKGGGESGSRREGEKEAGGRNTRRGREKDLVKNGHPAREDSLGLRRTMRPCSGRDSFPRSWTPDASDPTNSTRLIARERFPRTGISKDTSPRGLGRFRILSDRADPFLQR